MGIEYRIRMALLLPAAPEAILRKAAHGCHLEVSGAGGAFYPSAPSAPTEWAQVSVSIEADGFVVCLHVNSDFARQVFGRIVQLAAGEGIVTVEEL